MKNLIFVLMLLLFLSCKSESAHPYMKYSASFDGSSIEMVDAILARVALAHELILFKKDRKEMQYISKGDDAFFTALYFKDDPIFIMTNVGVTDTLVFTVMDYKKIPKVDLDRMAQEILEITKSDLKIKWEKKT